MKLEKKIVFCMLIAVFFAGISTLALAAETDKININTATAAELMQLQKIGEKTAANIIEYRTQNGPFTSLDDLKKVKGIGDKIFELNKDRLSADMPETGKKAADAAQKAKTEVPAKPAVPEVQTDVKKK